MSASARLAKEVEEEDDDEEKADAAAEEEEEEEGALILEERALDDGLERVGPSAEPLSHPLKRASSKQRAA